jgi:hypothetical protein
MIVEPWNDRQCLRSLHAQAREVSRSDEMRTFAEQMGGLRNLIFHIRGLPQREDVGQEGPRIQCGNVTQRVRVMPKDPNCFERTLWYLGCAEILRPERRRSSATAATDFGLHTFPVEEHKPVVLDVHTPPNLLHAALDQIRQMRGTETDLTRPGRLLSWFWSTAHNACRTEAERRFVQRGERTIRNGLRLGKFSMSPTMLEGVLGIAAREAELWPDGGQAIKQVGKSLQKLWTTGAIDPFVRAYAMAQLGPIGGAAALQAFDALREQGQQQGNSAEIDRLKTIVPTVRKTKGKAWQEKKPSNVRRRRSSGQT